MVEIVVGILVCRERDSMGAGGDALADRSARILVTRRPHETVLGGYWEFPGGKVEPGESPTEALRREFLEEVGLKVHVGDALPAVEHIYPHAAVRIEPFWCHADAQEPRNLAVAEHRWVRVDDLADLRFPPANAPILAAIRQAFSPTDSADSASRP